ncbi:MAG: hypothetical protein IJX91_01020 [Clostridia bacterium]|nr:hypothetical protein [Clostridia bacterium]
MKKNDGKKKGLRFLCALLALCSAFAFSACDVADILGGISLGGDSSSAPPSTEEDTDSSDRHSDKNTDKDSGSDGESANENTGDETSSGAEDTGDGGAEKEAPTGNVPDPQKPDLEPQAIGEKYGYRQLATYENGDGLRAFYADLYEAARAFAGSGKTVQSDSVNGEMRYRIGTMDYAQYEISLEQAVSVWRTVRAEYPEFYFLSNGLSFSKDEGILYFEIYPEYAKASTRAAIDKEIESLAEECSTYIDESMTEEEKILVLHDFVAAKITYAFESDGVTPLETNWAHNLVGAARYGAGVCETYAETFDYLCGAFGIECLTVVGEADNGEGRGGHEWNLFRIGEGETASWHAADVTWDDGADAQSFLLRKWLGGNETEYCETHFVETDEVWGETWQVRLPALSSKPLSPVLLRENSGENQLCLSIDDAFEKMTNEGSMYEITLYPETSVTENYGLTVYSVCAEFATAELPEVAQIKIVGTGFYPCEVTALNELTLTCETVLTDCTLYADIPLTDEWLEYENGEWIEKP